MRLAHSLIAAMHLRVYNTSIAIQHVASIVLNNYLIACIIFVLNLITEVTTAILIIIISPIKSGKEFTLNSGSIFVLELLIWKICNFVPYITVIGYTEILHDTSVLHAIKSVQRLLLQHRERKHSAAN